MVSAKISEILTVYEAELLTEWLQEIASNSNRRGLIKESELRQECREFFTLFRQGVQQDQLKDIRASAWQEVRDLLTNISHHRSQKGFSPSETASFVFSLKQPLFDRLRQTVGDSDALVDAVWAVTALLDKLGLFTTEVYQKSREAVILRQQEELMELSTPVVKLWDGILALPVIGTLDSHRTQVVMESLLQRIVVFCSWYSKI